MTDTAEAAWCQNCGQLHVEESSWHAPWTAAKATFPVEADVWIGNGGDMVAEIHRLRERRDQLHAHIDDLHTELDRLRRRPWNRLCEAIRNRPRQVVFRDNTGPEVEDWIIDQTKRGRP